MISKADMFILAAVVIAFAPGVYLFFDGEREQGMVVTIFLLFAALLTARQLFEMYLQERQKRDEKQATACKIAISWPTKPACQI